MSKAKMDFKKYYLLTKPGIIYGNLLTTTAGFFLASLGHIHIRLLFETLIGIAFVIASACVVNNYTDRAIDEKMERTKKRALVTKKIPVKNAIIFAVVLGFFGFAVLIFYTNFLTFLLGIIAYLTYVLFYAIGKRRSVHGTLIGSISGALPPVAGYCAVSNHFDMGALLLFFILVVWQMPHFYSIAIYRLKDYAKASIPVLPFKKGIFMTKIQIVGYALIFLIPLTLLTVLKFAGYFYLIIMLALAVAWFLVALSGFWAKDDTKWARKMFFYSLIIICTLSLVIPIDTLLRHGILLAW